MSQIFIISIALFSRTNQESIYTLDKRKLVINDIYHDKHTYIQAFTQIRIWK